MDIINLLQTIGFPLESIRMKQKAIKEIKDNTKLLLDYGIIFEPKSKLIYRKGSFENKITFMKGHIAENTLSLENDTEGI